VRHKGLLAFAVALGLVVASATVAEATSSATATDVQTLANAEAHVLAVLHQYKDTAAWEAEFNAAVATQNADLAKVKADISPPGPAGGVLFAMTGSGIESTTPFTVPGAAKGWHVNYTFNCSSFGGSGNFDWTVYQGNAMSETDFGPNRLAVSGSGVEHYYDTGTFHLAVDSECNWTVKVFPGS